jgi:hypothetical protein
MDQNRPKEIIGRNMFGVEDAIRHFGVSPTRQQTAALSKIRWREATLEQCRETHVLVAVFPLSIIEIRSKGKLFYNQSWYNQEPFANNRGDVSWQLVRKTAVDNSTCKTWQEQQALLANNEETPSARVMVYTIVGYYLATSTHLFERLYVRTSDVDLRGRCVDVGFFNSGGLDVSSNGGDYHYDALGLSAARKFDC